MLVLLIVSVGVHFALSASASCFFGAEGFRNPSFWDARFAAGALHAHRARRVIIFVASIALIVALCLFFERTLRGKALRATAVNRARRAPDGHLDRPARAASRSRMAAFIGALSGLLIGPTTTIFYDSRLPDRPQGLRRRRSFGGLASYPLRAASARCCVGLLESFGSFWASAFKEVIVFTLILPVLLWRSLRDPHDEEERLTMNALRTLRASWLLRRCAACCAAAAAAGARLLDHAGATTSACTRSSRSAWCC